MPYKRLRYKCYDLQCHKSRRTMTSIVPYKSFVGLRQSIYLSLIHISEPTRRS